MVKFICICALSASIPEHQACALPKESRKGLNLLELELMVVKSLDIDIKLRIDPGSPERAASARNHQVISLALKYFKTGSHRLSLTAWSSLAAHLALNSQQCPECWAQPDAHPQHLVSEGRRVKTKAQVSYGHLVLELAIDAPAAHLAAGVTGVLRRVHR